MSCPCHDEPSHLPCCFYETFKKDTDKPATRLCILYCTIRQFTILLGWSSLRNSSHCTRFTPALQRDTKISGASGRRSMSSLSLHQHRPYADVLMSLVHGCFLCCHHTSPGGEGSKSGDDTTSTPPPTPPQPELCCWWRCKWVSMLPSWCNGNMHLPSGSRCREKLLINAAWLWIRACWR